MTVVAVPVDHRVDVHVPQTWQHRHSLSRNHLIPARHRLGLDRTDGGDPLAVNEDDRVAYRAPAVAVDQRTADERDLARLLRVQG